MTLATRVSFHDPDGSVFLGGDRVRRVLRAEAAARVMSFASTDLAKSLLVEGRITGIEAIRSLGSDDSACWFEHPRLPFTSYPHEWTPEQLLEAADATLMLAQRLRADGWDLKDGNLRNIVFEGRRPVFVDWGSFVQRNDTTPVWRPAGQLQRQAVLPLLLFRHRGWPVHELLLSNPDGLDPVRARRGLGAGVVWRDPAVLWNVALPAWLGQRGAAPPVVGGGRSVTPEVARRTADMTIAGMRRTLARLRARLPPPLSEWSAYEGTRKHYRDEELAAKRRAVDDLLAELRPSAVLDIGANGGEFSNAAARVASIVVAVDRDIDALRIARRATAATGSGVVHHLVADIAAPTPALGWNAAECLSLAERCHGRFDMVMALAVLHHLTVSGGIPLDEVVGWLASCTRRHLVVEFVDPSDPRFVQIAAARGLDGRGLQRDDFERALAAHFEVQRCIEMVKGRRWLYHAERR